MGLADVGSGLLDGAVTLAVGSLLADAARRLVPPLGLTFVAVATGPEGSGAKLCPVVPKEVHTMPRCVSRTSYA